MRVHTTAVPATKYLPERVHVKLTNDADVPNNKKDKTYNVLPGYTATQTHEMFAEEFAKSLGYTLKLPALGETLIRRGWKYEIVESV
jgi:hypothetical protein